MSGAICGDPTPMDRLVGWGKEWEPVIVGARCHDCGWFLSDVTKWIGSAMLGGWDIGPTVALVTGRCRRHGYVEADGYDVWWNE